MKRRARSSALKNLLPQLGIPPLEQARVEDDLLRGVALFRQDNDFARTYSDAELLDRPFVFGIGAIEALRDTVLSIDTRFAIVRHTLGHINPIDDHGVPFGLPILTSFVAGIGLLSVPLFRTLFQINHMERDWYYDWPIAEIRVLLDWLIVKAEVADDERLWWLFYLLVHCEQPDKGKAMFAFVSDHPALPITIKRRLNAEILNDKRSTLIAPPQWRALQAMWRGDRAAYQAARAEMPVDEQLPFIPDDDAFMEDIGPEEAAEPLSFDFVRSLLFDDFMLTPGFLKRQAISSLVTLGEDPLTVCHLYLGKHGYYTDAINSGVADVLSAHPTAISDQSAREVIDRALTIGTVITRKAFYRAGIDRFGAEYLKRAQADSADSIRQWANKLTRGETSMLKKRGRKPKSTG